MTEKGGTRERDRKPKILTKCSGKCAEKKNIERRKGKNDTFLSRKNEQMYEFAWLRCSKLLPRKSLLS